MRHVYVLIFVLFAAAVMAQTNPAKLGVIDVERVISESAAGKEAFLKLKRLQEDKEKDGKKLVEDLSAMEKQLTDQKFLLSDEKLKELQKAYEDRQIAFKRFKDDSERDLKNARDEELKKLEEKIFPIINQVGKDMGYAMLFNKYNSGLVFADDAADITDEILKRFNTQVNLPAPKKQDTPKK